ncbi:MAG: heme-copper oxidase subunit III, partial [Bacteroidota bacterium]
MDLTQGTLKEKTIRAKKMMLWFAIGSIIMMFGGLTSAYVVSKTRPDWLADFQLPSAFLISTVVILLSSITLHFAKATIKKGEASARGTGLLLATFLLG